MSTSTIASNTQQTPTVVDERTWHMPPWGWSLIGAVGILIATATLGSAMLLSPLLQALTLAPYLVLVAVGQMMVMTLGPGNIDISVAAVVSLSSYVSVAVAVVGGPVVGIVAGMGMGATVALCSVLAILLLRVPPIIATLATSLIATSATLVMADSSRGGASKGLISFVNVKLIGIPVSAILVGLVTVAVAFALKRTVYGVSVVAIGQNEKAAGKAGVPLSLTIACTYLLSGAMAGLSGALLAAFISPSTGLGDSYLLDSVAVVVVGGTLVAGGRPSPFGLWTGALFFVLLSGLMNLVGWSLGAQNVLKGLLVVAVVLVSGTATPRARAKSRKTLARLKSSARRKETHNG
jgi:ribose transport system permease protein